MTDNDIKLNNFPDIPSSIVKRLNDNRLSGAIGGIINNNSNIKCESNLIDTGLVPHITINNGKSELLFNQLDDILETGMTFNNGTIENEKSGSDLYRENITEINFPNYSVGYTAEFRNIISGKLFSGNYDSSTFFTSVLLNNGIKEFWSDITDGYVLRDVKFQLSSLFVYSTQSDLDINSYNFSQKDIISVTDTNIVITGNILSNLGKLTVNSYITNNVGQIYQIYQISNINENNETITATLNFVKQKSIFNIIPKNLKGHNIKLYIFNNINNPTNIDIENFSNGNIYISGKITINNNKEILTDINNNFNLINNNCQLKFENIRFVDDVYCSNCTDLIFKRCQFNKKAFFDNCKVQILHGDFTNTLSGINNSQIFAKYCTCNKSKKVVGLSNSQITWLSSSFDNDYKSYIYNDRISGLNNIIDTSFFSGNELSDQNALTNHYHKQIEHIVPMQYIQKENNKNIAKSYIDSLPVGSIIYWPESVTLNSSNELINLCPELQDSYERCDGESIEISRDNQLLKTLISNKFNTTTSGVSIIKPNLISGYLKKNDKFYEETYGEVYSTSGSFLFGDSMDDEISLKYVARWCGGYAQLHNASVTIKSNVSWNSYLKYWVSSSQSGHGNIGGAIVLALDMPSNYTFGNNDEFCFLGYANNITTTNWGQAGILLLNNTSIKALFISNNGSNVCDNNGLIINSSTNIWPTNGGEAYNGGRPKHCGWLTPSYDSGVLSNIEYWYNCGSNDDDQGSDVSKPIRRIMSFNLSDGSGWRNNSKPLTYNNSLRIWSIKTSEITDSSYYISYTDINNKQHKILYFMIYLDNVTKNYQYIQIEDFFIKTGDIRNNLFNFNFNSDHEGTGGSNAFGDWSCGSRYNVFHQYMSTPVTGDGYGGSKCKSSNVFRKYIPYIKINNNIVTITDGPEKQPVEESYLLPNCYPSERDIKEYIISPGSSERIIYDKYSKYLPTYKQLEYAYCGQVLYSKTEYNKISSRLAQQGSYYDLNTHKYIVSSQVKEDVPDLTCYINKTIESVSAEIDYNFADTLNTLPFFEEKFYYGVVKFDIKNDDPTQRKWNADKNLMVIPLKYETVDFVYNNLINNSIQNLHGKPSEKGSIELLNTNGIGVVSGANSKYIKENDSTNNDVLKYNDYYSNIPIIPVNTITDELVLRITGNESSLSTLGFFGLGDNNGDTYTIYDLKQLSNNNISGIYWQTHILSSDNNYKLFNYDRTHTPTKASGFLFDNIEQTTDTIKKFGINPYGISNTSSYFINGTGIPASVAVASSFCISVGSTPRYTGINYDTLNNNSDTNSLKIKVSSTEKSGLLNCAKRKINYYCDRLSAVFKKEFSTKNKIYSYKDLSDMVNDTTSYKSLASAIIQYRFGSEYCVDGKPVIANSDSIITTQLGTLNKYNWLKWETQTYAINDLFNSYTVDYTTDNNWSYDWVANGYNINKII